MNTFCEQFENVTVVTIQGEFATPDSLRFKDFLMQRIESGVIEILIDFSDVPMIDSSGISALLALLQAVRRRGGDIRVSSVGDRLDEVFNQVGLQHVFKHYLTRDDGIASFLPMASSER